MTYGDKSLNFNCSKFAAVVTIGIFWVGKIHDLQNTADTIKIATRDENHYQRMETMPRKDYKATRADKNGCYAQYSTTNLADGEKAPRSLCHIFRWNNAV